MARINFIFFALLIIMAGCKHSGKKSESEFRKLDTLVNSKDLKLVAVFLDSINYQFEYSIRNQEHRSQIFKQFPSGLPTIEWYNADWAFLRGGCGSACFYGYLIPLTLKDTTRTFMFPSFTDQSRNIVVYCSDEKLIIENYLMHKAIEFNDPILTGPYCSFNIKRITFDGFFLIIDFVDGPTQKKIDISSLTE